MLGRLRQWRCTTDRSAPAEPKRQEQLWGTAKIRSFTDPKNFIEWWTSDGKLSEETIVLDLHLSKYVSGLDVIREIGQRAHTYFSTSDFLNQELIETATEYSVKIIPKQLI